MTSQRIELRRLRAKLEKCWDRKTAHPKWASLWEPWRASLGQCYVTALIVQDIFGGRLVKNKAGLHIWNRLPSGLEVDLTNDQLGRTDIFKSVYEGAGLSYLLPESYGAKRSNHRYKLLKRRLEAL